MTLWGRSFIVLAGVAALPLTACSLSEETPANEAVAEMATTGSVTREEIKAEDPPVQPMAPLAVIQSQPGPDGSQIDLLKLAVTGDILTVTMRCSSESDINGETFAISEISIIDDASAQRISVLKDNDGNAIVSDFSKGASPTYDSLETPCKKTPSVFWVKFPAPPATSKTISIMFPGVGAFDGIPLTR